MFRKPTRWITALCVMALFTSSLADTNNVPAAKKPVLKGVTSLPELPAIQTPELAKPEVPSKNGPAQGKQESVKESPPKRQGGALPAPTAAPKTKASQGAPVKRVPMAKMRPNEGGPQPEPPTAPGPRGTVMTPRSGAETRAPSLPSSSAPVLRSLSSPPSPGGVSPGAAQALPGAVPSPGSGSGSAPPRGGFVPSREMIEEVRGAHVSCTAANTPAIRIEQRPRRWETLSNEAVRLEWSVRHGDGTTPWTRPVYLRDRLRRDASRQLVDPVGHRTIGSAGELGSGVRTYVVETQCGSEEAQVSRLAPMHAEVSESVCERHLGRIGDPVSERSCDRIVIRGRGFGPELVPYREVRLSSGTSLEIESWSDRVISARLRAPVAAGTHRVVVTRGRSAGASESVTADLSVRWEERLAMGAMVTIVEGLFGGMTMVLDNLTERHCEWQWWPTWESAGRLTGAELAERRDYCLTSHDETQCRRVNACTVASTDESFIDIDGAGPEPRSPLVIPPQSVDGGIYGRGWYFVTDIRSNRASAQLDELTARLSITIPFESEGLEFRGFDTNDGDGDWRWPDGHINGMRVILELLPTLADGQLTYGPSNARLEGRIQAEGACRGVIDLCDALADYKNQIRDGVRRQLMAHLNSAENQRRIRGSIAEILELFGITSVSHFSVQVIDGNRWFVVRP